VLEPTGAEADNGADWRSRRSRGSNPALALEAAAPVEPAPARPLLPLDESGAGEAADVVAAPTADEVSGSGKAGGNRRTGSRVRTLTAKAAESDQFAVPAALPPSSASSSTPPTSASSAAGAAATTAAPAAPALATASRRRKGQRSGAGANGGGEGLEDEGTPEEPALTRRNSGRLATTVDAAEEPAEPASKTSKRGSVDDSQEDAATADPASLEVNDEEADGGEDAGEGGRSRTRRKRGVAEARLAGCWGSV
jgi:hypothetical protein